MLRDLCIVLCRSLWLVLSLFSCSVLLRCVGSSALSLFRYFCISVLRYCFFVYLGVYVVRSCVVYFFMLLFLDLVRSLCLYFFISGYICFFISVGHDVCMGSFMFSLVISCFFRSVFRSLVISFVRYLFRCFVRHLCISFFRSLFL